MSLESSVFQKFFSNFTEVSKCQKTEQLRELRNYGGANNMFFSFLAIFDKNTGHKVTNFYPLYRIYITYKFFIIFFSSSKKDILSFFI